MRNRPPRFLLVSALLLSLVPAVFHAQAASPVTVQTAVQSAPEVFQGKEIENFLLHGKVVANHGIPTGVTHPRRVTLELDGVRHDAVFKSIDEFRPGVTQFEGGKPEIDFQDSYKTEIAAYELDKLVGLGMVPATVAREIGHDRGSLQYWVTSQMIGEQQLTEQVRLERKIQPPDIEKWNEEMYKARMWDSLIYNVDRNVGNVLVTPDWHVVLIDHSRTFRRFKELEEQKGMTRFSRTLLAAFERLDEKALTEHLGKYLTGYQIKGILTRRDEIVALAHELAEKNGEARVMFD